MVKNVNIWIHDDRTDGVKPIQGKIERVGQFLHMGFAGVHIAIKAEDLEELMEQGDDRK